MWRFNELFYYAKLFSRDTLPCIMWEFQRTSEIHSGFSSHFDDDNDDDVAVNYWPVYNSRNFARGDGRHSLDGGNNWDLHARSDRVNPLKNCTRHRQSGRLVREDVYVAKVVRCSLHFSYEKGRRASSRSRAGSQSRASVRSLLRAKPYQTKRRLFERFSLAYL